MSTLSPFDQALQDEGVFGTPLEQIARKTRGFESSNNPNAVSNRGARGGMQVLPTTFASLADKGWDINDDYHNSRAGIRYLKQGWEKSGGDAALTGAYYYGGPNGLNKARQGIAVSDPMNPNYPNTLQYGKRLADSVKGANMNSSLPLTRGNQFQGIEDYVNEGNKLLPPVNPSPELTELMTQNMRRRSSNLPLALGSMLSRDKGVRNFGGAIYDDANDAQNPQALGDEGFFDPQSGNFVASPIGDAKRKQSILNLSLNAMQGNRQKAPYYTFSQSAKGLVKQGSDGSVEYAKDSEGNPVISLAADPTAQRELASAKKGGGVEGEFNANQILNAPKLLRDAQYASKLIDDLLMHPGREQATGFSRITGWQHVPGTDAKSFDIALEQIKGQQFLEAFQSLKGGGAITQVEGEKATQAISRMNASNSEEEFKKAALEFQSIVQAAAKRAEAIVNGGGQPQQPSSGNPKPQGGLSPEEQREYEELQAWSAKR